jgi:ABC-type lipoprotein release transport system permease subunit
MIIGEGVKEFLDDLHYFKYYTFRPPDKSKEKVYIYNKFPHATSLLTNDMVIMDIALARKILGIPQGYFSDIILKVPNKKEHQMVYEKLFLTHFDMRIITKEDIAKHFKKLFNTKGGVFLILYIVVLVSFLLLLYQRYSMVGSGEKKEIALLRSVGWRIEQVLWLKVVENGIIALSAFLLGVIFAYVYVFFADAPLLRDIFLGTNNFSAHLSLYPVIHLGDIALLFAFFVIPFLVAVVVPLWRLSITDISEVLR